jgi:hypothetical protein
MGDGHGQFAQFAATNKYLPFIKNTRPSQNQFLVKAPHTLTETPWHQGEAGYAKPF